ncbi:hypothetical protein, partial [Salinisphaera sp.]|uniref:hypothetical protein n=1 Tax=Salinisphaera sp. TaxID=1914330 RepID=UPI002D7688ED
MANHTQQSSESRFERTQTRDRHRLTRQFKKAGDAATRAKIERRIAASVAITEQRAAARPPITLA